MNVIVIIVLSVLLVWSLFSRSGHVSKAWQADRRVDAAHDRERKWCQEKVALERRIAELETTLGHWRSYQADRLHMNEEAFLDHYYRNRS